MGRFNKNSISAKNVQTIFNFLKLSLAFLVAILIVVVVIFLCADEPFSTMHYFFLSPFDSVRHMGNIIENATPVLFTGVATCLLFSAGDVTLAGEGAVYFGGFVASAVAVSLPIQNDALKIIALLTGALVGILIAVLPAFVQNKFKVDSFVFSLLFNYVLLYIGSYFLNYKLHDYSYKSGTATAPFPEFAVLHSLIPKTSVNVGFFIGLLLAVGAWVFSNKTKWGYEAKLLRSNPHFAKYVGVNVVKISLIAAALGGFVAALGGGVEILGKAPRFSWTALPGYGWDGFMVATLAYYNPILVPFAALFLGYLRTGANIMNLYSNIPLELISAIQAVMILLISSKAMLNKSQQRMIEKQTRLRAQQEEKSGEGA